MPHAPVDEGDCLVCHLPHLSDFRSMITEKTSVLCAACHNTGTGEFLTAHKGYDVTEANCVGCHDPHTSKEEGLMPTVMHEPYGEFRCELCHK